MSEHRQFKLSLTMVAVPVELFVLWMGLRYPPVGWLLLLLSVAGLVAVVLLRLGVLVPPAPPVQEAADPRDGDATRRECSVCGCPWWSHASHDGCGVTPQR